MTPDAAGIEAALAAGRIKIHNGAEITTTNLRWAATHEALSRSYIFDVLTGLADALDARADESDAR